MVANTAQSKFIEEHLKARRAQFALSNSKYIMWATLFVTAVLLVTWSFLQQYSQLILLAVLFAAVGTCSRMYVVFHHRGQQETGIRVFIGSLLTSLALIPLLLPEVLLVMPSGYALAIAIGYLLLGDRGGYWLIVISGVVFATDAILITFGLIGWFAPLGEPARMIVGVLLAEVVLLIVTILIRIIVLSQETLFRESQQANLEIQDLAAAEREQHGYLQTTIAKYVEVMSDVAHGDLSSRVPLDGHERAPDDPLLVLGHNLNDTIASLQQMTSQIRETAANLNSASSEILAATTQQATGATQQSSAIAQTSSTIDEVRAIADQTAQRARSVADIAHRTAQVSQTGRQAVVATIGGMQEVRDKVETIATNILALSEQAQSIGQIITTVNEIATQSNMLALNASVEAARAGEAGKGFAVVAAEVRALAEQSRAATVQVQEILGEIQRGVNTAVMATEEGMKGTDAGMRLAGDAGLSIQQLAEEVTTSAQSAAQIAAAANQQLTGMEQIAAAMENIHKVTAQSLASTRQSERAAEKLTTIAAQLRQIVGQYRL